MQFRFVMESRGKSAQLGVIETDVKKCIFSI